MAVRAVSFADDMIELTLQCLSPFLFLLDLGGEEPESFPAELRRCGLLVSSICGVHEPDLLLGTQQFAGDVLKDVGLGGFSLFKL